MLNYTEHVFRKSEPNEIYVIPEVPRTLNGKKLEVPIKKLLMGIPIEKAVNKDSVSNFEAIKFFLEFKNQINIFVK